MTTNLRKELIRLREEFLWKTFPRRCKNQATHDLFENLRQLSLSIKE